jgi:hypothetical protein
MQTISSQPSGYPDPREFFFGTNPIPPATKPPGDTKPKPTPQQEPKPTEPAKTEGRSLAS